MSPNLTRNSSFMGGKVGWAGDDNTNFTLTQNGYGGTAGARLVPVARGDVRLTDSPDTVEYTTAGATYTATARVKNPIPGTTIKGSLSLLERSSGETAPLSKSTAFTLADTSWRTVTVSGIAAGNVVGAAGAHGLDLYVAGHGLATTQRLRVDDITLRRTTANVAPTPAFDASSRFLTARFDAAASFDADGSIASYMWDYGDGTTGTGRGASHTYTSAGHRTVTLTVKDRDGATRSISKPIQVVANEAPSASFASTVSYLKVNLTASATDSDGSIASYLWDFGDGTTGRARSTTHTYASPGAKTITLTVTDNAGAKKTVTRVVEVVANNLPTGSFTSSSTGLRAKLEATAADNDGTVSSYRWDYGDGTTGMGQRAWHTYAAAGTYPVTLTVKDNAGGSTTVKRPVTVVDNVAPTAVINASSSYLVGKFNASGSADSDGNISSYQWAFGDGSTARGSWVSHTYAAAGTYTVTLTVTDNGGAATTRTTQVTVVANIAPTAQLSSAMSYLTAALDGTGSRDTDGRIASYAWDFGDGASAAGPAVTHTYAEPGSYVVSLTVTDQHGAQTRVSSTVTAVPRIPTGKGPLWGMYNGDYGEEAAKTMFGGTPSTPLAERKYVEITSQYYQMGVPTADPATGAGKPYADGSWYRDFKTPTFPNFKLAQEKAQADKGIAKIMTFAAHSSRVVPAIANGRAANPALYDWALSVVDAWIANCKQVYDYDPKRRLWVGMNSEPDVGFQQGTYPFSAAQHGKFFSFFYDRIRQQVPGMKSYMQLGGYQTAWINDMFKNMTAAPDLIAVDPYVNGSGNQTMVNSFNSDLNKFRLSTGAWRAQYLRLSNLPRVGVAANSGTPIPFGISEHGVDKQDHTDAEIASYIRQGRAAMNTTDVQFAIWFNSDSGPQGDHRLTPASNPLASAAFRDVLFERATTP